MNPEPPPPGYRQFAVLIPLVKRDDEDHVLLIKRLERPDDPYSGQVCLPGGAHEASDASLTACALREAEEEVGISPAQVEILEEINWQETSLGHRVKAFAGRVRAPLEIRLSPTEVEKVLYLPVRNVDRDLFQVRGQWRDATHHMHTVLTFQLDGHEVWGLTARILYAYFCGDGR